MAEMLEIRAHGVEIDQDSLKIDLVDGRSVSVPLAWYPRLMHGTHEQRSNWRFVGAGEGMHWPDLDEDISVENLPAGKPSGESHQSFKKWLSEHSAPPKRTNSG